MGKVPKRQKTLRIDYLTLSWRRPLSCRNQFIDLRSMKGLSLSIPRCRFWSWKKVFGPAQKLVKMDHNGRKCLKGLFFISFRTPPCRPGSQRKMKIIEHATTCDNHIILCNSNVSHFLTCPKTWKNDPDSWKRLKWIIFHKF